MKKLIALVILLPILAYADQPDTSARKDSLESANQQSEKVERSERALPHSIDIENLLQVGAFIQGEWTTNNFVACHIWSGGAQSEAEAVLGFNVSVDGTRMVVPVVERDGDVMAPVTTQVCEIVSTEIINIGVGLRQENCPRDYGLRSPEVLQLHLKCGPPSDIVIEDTSWLDERNLLIGDGGNVVLLSVWEVYLELKRPAPLGGLSSMKQSNRGAERLEATIVEFETERFRVRIDRADDRLRYTSWEKQKRFADEPDLVLQNGRWVSDGDEGNGYYLFKNGEYHYLVKKWEIVTPSTPPDSLIVSHGEKQLVSEPILLADPHGFFRLP